LQKIPYFIYHFTLSIPSVLFLYIPLSIIYIYIYTHFSNKGEPTELCCPPPPHHHPRQVHPHHHHHGLRFPFSPRPTSGHRCRPRAGCPTRPSPSRGPSQRVASLSARSTSPPLTRPPSPRPPRPRPLGSAATRLRSSATASDPAAAAPARSSMPSIVSTGLLRPSSPSRSPGPCRHRRQFLRCRPLLLQRVLCLCLYGGGVGEAAPATPQRPAPERERRAEVVIVISHHAGPLGWWRRAWPWCGRRGTRSTRSGSR
ncbi:hypothetical protein BAE44_0004284, partial [Dichanthelium oligosanthes]